MRLLRSAPVLVLLTLGAASQGSGGEGADPKERRVSLPTEWNVGSVHRYRAQWTREVSRWTAPGTPPPALEADQAGEITIRVVGKSGSAYQLRWEPALPAASGPPRARGDVDAAGLELRRHGLSQALDLFFDPKSADKRLALRNEPALRAELSRLMRDFLRELPGGEDAATAAPETLAAPWLQYTAPFFNCSGLELNAGRAEMWTSPHPNPEIGAAVSIVYRREVVDFDPRSPRIRIRTVTQPNTRELDAFVTREMAKTNPSQKVMEALSQWMVRFETTCTMDRDSGWPVTIEQRATASTKAYEGAEIIRFELIGDTSTKASRRR